MSRPLVSVLTPTWQRHALLLEAIENVRAQTYPNLEHIIVSDGQDTELEDLIDELTNQHVADFVRPPRGKPCIPIIFQQLGRNWSSELEASFCAAPLVTAQLLARGEYQCVWSDDERADPEHITKMVDLLETTGADFVHPKVRMHRPGQAPEDGFVIGTDPPQCGQITHWLNRTSLLKKGLYPFGAGGTSDWSQVSLWMSRGATHAFLPEVTFTHRYDR